MGVPLMLKRIRRAWIWQLVRRNNAQFRAFQASACTWLSIIFVMYKDNPKESKFRRLPLGQIKAAPCRRRCAFGILLSNRSLRARRSRGAQEPKQRQVEERAAVLCRSIGTARNSQDPGLTRSQGRAVDAAEADLHWLPTVSRWLPRTARRQGGRACLGRAGVRVTLCSSFGSPF